MPDVAHFPIIRGTQGSISRERKSFSVEKKKRGTAQQKKRKDGKTNDVQMYTLYTRFKTLWVKTYGRSLN